MSYEQSQAPVYARAFLDAIAGAFTTAPTKALVPTPTVHLLGGSPGTLTPDTTLSSLTALEANFSGYSAAALTLAGPVTVDENNEGMIGQVHFIATTASPFVSSNLYGYFIEAGGNLIMSELFPTPTPVPIAAPGDFLSLDLALPVSAVKGS